MARGVQFGTMVERLRAETRQSTQLSVGTDSLPHVKQILRRVQETLYTDPANDWSFLRVVASKAISAGDRYYDFPLTLNPDRVEKVVVMWGSQPVPLIRGIDFPEYALRDSDEDERADPVQNWDLRWTGSATQFEVWPLPATNGTVKFRGLRPLNDLVDDTDTCDLDDTLIILFAAAEILAAQESKDASAKLSQAQSHLRALKSNTQAGAKSVSMVPRTEPLGSHIVVQVR